MTSTSTLTIRLPEKLALDFKAKARAAKTTPSAVLRGAITNYVSGQGSNVNAMQQHILDRAGTWEGHCSGEELLRRTRP